MKFWCLESWSSEEKFWLMAGPKNSCFQWLCRSLKGFDFAALNWRSMVWLDAAPWCTLVSCYLCVCPLCITEESLIFWLTFLGIYVFYYQQIGLRLENYNCGQVLQRWVSQTICVFVPKSKLTYFAVEKRKPCALFSAGFHIHPLCAIVIVGRETASLEQFVNSDLHL